MGTIAGNWALALYGVGNLRAARERHLESAEAERKAGNPAINVVVSEVEALRIDIMEGRVAEALPQIESRLEQVGGCWRRLRSGQQVAEAPDIEFLARAYIGALDIAREADYVREDWESALRWLDTTLKVKHELERPAADIGGTRANRANVFGRLGRFSEAVAELEACGPRPVPGPCPALPRALRTRRG